MIGGSLRGRIVGLYGLLIAANVAAWGWALVAFRHHPELLATSLVAYGFGLRHAVDADHIAAIDNVTRKLMAEGKRPLCVGLFFSLGHSTVVILASIAVALAATGLEARFHDVQTVGGIVGTLVSGVFLVAIAAINTVILVDLWRRLRQVRAGLLDASEVNAIPAGGLMSRLFGRAMRLISRSSHMFPLGFLFGLGFDTATEIGLLGLAAASATKGLPVVSILVFPALFTAGMSLVDTTDGVLMLGAYGWAFVEPMRKIYYNLAITLLSVAVAVAVGGIEVIGLLADQLAAGGPFRDGIGWLNDNLDMVGFVIVGLFLAAWAASALLYGARRRDGGSEARRVSPRQRSAAGG